MEQFLTSYTQFVTQYKFIAAFVQFALLGTLGEYFSYEIKRWRFPSSKIIFYTPLHIPLVMLGWGLLGIVIKYGFCIMRGGVENLFDEGLLPIEMNTMFLRALILSIITNLFFGPQMMLLHRATENLIRFKWHLNGMEKAFLTLLWFWIPAHTITFILPVQYQIGLAALWSIVLGLIMGLTSK